MKWRAPGTTNSIPKVQMQPRITMFVALDTAGQVYLSLLQSNSNSKVMEIFLRQLVLKLDREDADGRDSTVILHDNAPYATSESTLELMKGLRIPMVYTGPYSYDAAPVELVVGQSGGARGRPQIPRWVHPRSPSQARSARVTGQ